jgi:hypothetical protein
MIKYLFFHSYFILLSFTSGSLSKSKFHHEIITTIVFQIIFSFKSFSASVDKAQAGSTIIQSSFKYSKIVEQILFSGQATTSRLYFFAISKVFSHTFFTLAQSTNISIFSSATFCHVLSDSFIDGAQAGSTHIIFVSFFNSLVALISPETTHHHQMGQTI